MKSAMQEVQDAFKTMSSDIFFMWYYDNKERLLEKEKQHIIEAFDNGVIDGAWGSKFKNAEQYYKETYETKKSD